MKKYFKFTTFCNNWKLFLFIMITSIAGQYYDGWTVNQMIKSNIVIAVVAIFGSLVGDWLQIKNNNSKDENSEE